MAVKSASERNSQDEAVRRTRETYQKREAENAKKQSAQAKQTVETAQAELEAVRADHAKQMDELKAKTAESISRRDMQYQKEISELRELHQKQLQRVAGDAELKQLQTENTLKSEINRTVQTTAQQREELKTSYEGQLKEKDTNFENSFKSAREEQAKANEGLRDRMNKAHDKETKALIEDRNARLSDQQRENREIRRNKDGQLKAAEASKKETIERLSTNHETTMKEQAANTQLSHELTREQFEQGIRRNRERFDKATEQLSENAENAREGFKGTINGRMGDRVKALEVDNRRLKSDITRNEIKHGQQKSLEMQNLRDAMNDNIRNLEKARLKTVEASNQKTSQELNRSNKNNDELLNRTNRFYQEKISMEGLRNDERLANTEGDLTKSLQHEKTTADSRIRKLQNFSELEQGKMRSFFDRATGSMKENFETTLRETRERNQKDQQGLMTQFAKQSQENDAKFQSKIVDVGTKYETQLAETKEAHLKQLKDQQALADRQKKEIEKKASTDIKAQAAQYEYRIAKIQDQHERQVQSLKAQQQESLANLTKNRKT